MDCPFCIKDEIVTAMIRKTTEDGGDFVYEATGFLLSGPDEGVALAPDHGKCELFKCPECGESVSRMTSAITGRVEIHE